MGTKSLSKRRVGYVRVSTSGQSPDGQVDALCAAGVPAHCITIEQSSGAAKRPLLRELIDSLEQGDTLYITRLDRLGRSVTDLGRLSEEFEDRGIHLIATEQALDTSGPMGRLVWHVLAAAAEFERELTRERCVRGQQRARAQGRHVGRPPALTPMELQSALSWRADGVSLMEISRRLHVSDQTVRRALKKHREYMLAAKQRHPVDLPPEPPDETA